MAPALAYATAFGLALLQALVGLDTQPSDTNPLVSPLSGAAALTLALNAAGEWKRRTHPVVGLGLSAKLKEGQHEGIADIKP